MGQIVYRGNLAAKAFPLLTDFHGRSVIVAGNDNTFSYQLNSPEDLDRDVGIPMVYYAHNVLPAPYGIASVGYESLLSSSLSAFTEVKLLRSNPLSATVDGPRIYFSPKVDGTHKQFGLGGTAWTNITGSIPLTSSTVVTYATVQGITYIFFSNIGCYKYDSTSNSLVSVTLTALTASVILGITSYQGYMICYDESSIYWSSTLDIDYTTNAIDFTPSLTSGAGQIKPEGSKGPIRIVMPATFGVSIYTTSNIVSAVYSGNSRYPFNFKEVVSSGGCSDQHLIAYDANTGNQYTYTTSGMQTVTSTATQTIFPEITDFLAGQDFEDFDETTQTFSITKLTTPLLKRISSVSDRYLIFSYGISSLTHAIVYDMTMKRYGKLKVDHVQCFEYEYLDPAIADAPRRSIAFLKSNGSISVVNPSVTFATSSGVVLLGKFQYVRSRMLTLESLEIQAIHPTQQVTAYDLVSVTGGTIESVSKYQFYETSLTGQSQRTYKIHKTGTNHSVLLVGGFFLSSIVIAFHVHGRR